MADELTITKETQDLIKTDFTEDVLKNNEINFDIDGIKYRVRKPSFEQRQAVVSARTKYLIGLLKDTNNLLEKDLIQIYESRGISINELNRNIDNLQGKIEEVRLALGNNLAENRPESELLPHKKEIERLMAEQNQFIMKKSNYLENSVESQVNVYTYVYLAAMITEKLVNNPATAETGDQGASWGKGWASYDEFIKQPEATVNKVVWYASLVSRNDLPTL